MNIFCIEQNYYLPQHERPGDGTAKPVIFLKPQSSLWQPGASFRYPIFAHELYCGCELILRISKNGRNIPAELARNYYDAISVGINFTALYDPDDLSREELTWEQAKAWDHSSVEGLWMPAENFNNVHDINFCLYKNRTLVQLGNSASMVHDFDTIIAGVSTSFRVNPGDIVFTGTPVGSAQILAGDKLEAFIEDDSVIEFDVEE